MAPAGVDLFVLYMGGAAAGAASSAAVGGNAALGAWMGGFSTLVGGGANLGLGAMGVNGSIGQGLGQIGAGAVGGGLAAMAMGESFGDGARVGAISAAITFGARTMAAYVARGAAVKSTNGQSQRTAVALAVVGTCVPGTACNPDVDWGVGILKGDTFYARVEWGMQDLENGPSFVGLRYWTTPNGDAWYDNGVAGFGFREYPAFIEQMMQTGRAGGQWTIPLPYGTTGVVFWTNNPSNAGTYDPAIKPWGMTFEFH
jgi:hypothetical protein